VLIDRGDRWVADASYEQWLTDAVTGRAWVRWQSSCGRFSALQVSDTEWPYTPEWQGGGQLDYIDDAGWRIGLEALVVGSRFGDPANTQRVRGYTIYNLGAEYQRNLHEEYFLRLTNLTGKDYETFAGFPQPGRAVLAGLKYRF
jgi:outer membrane receptor protein involved in Fe transport